MSLKRKHIVAKCLKWVARTFSPLWAMRVVRGLPGSIKDFETEVTFNDLQFHVYTGGF